MTIHQQSSLLLRQLETIYANLRAIDATSTSPAALNGRENDVFIKGFLKQVFPPTYQFNSGIIVDANNAESGQVDVVVGLPFAPSIPMESGGNRRLFFADAVGAAIAIKSDLDHQWQELVVTTNRLEIVKRNIFLSLSPMAIPISATVPLFVVGYQGWPSKQAYRDYLLQYPTIAGILAIKPGMFAFRDQMVGVDGKLAPTYHITQGTNALWAFIAAIHQEVQKISLAFIGLASYGDLTENLN
jgi:hypothetical protein